MPTVSDPHDADHPQHSTARGRLSKRTLWAWLGTAAAAALVACYRIKAEVLLLGSVEGGWTFAYVRDFYPSSLAIAVAAIVVAALPLLLLAPGERGRDGPILFAWMVAGLAVQAIVHASHPFGFGEIFASDIANSFYSVARHFTPGSVLAHFDELRADWPLHAQSNMPGKLMLLFLFKNISRRPDVMAWLTVVVSNLGAPLMYGFVRELFADRRVALNAAILYLLVPSKLYFFPLLNTVTPAVVLACALLLVVWLRSGRPRHAAAFGASLFGLIFFEPLPLVMGALFGALVGRALWLRQISGRRLFAQIGVGIAAWLVAYGLVRVAFGFDLILAFREISAHALRFNEHANRPYDIWVRENLREFLFGVGVCQAIVWIAALADGLGTGASWRERLTQPITTLTLGTLAVLLAVDAIGANRGEVIRLWIFLACFFQIPTAYVCARLRSPLAMLIVVGVTILQATLGTAMIGFIGP